MRGVADESWMQAAENPNGGPQPFVRFYIEPLKNEEKSLQEGRPVFEDVEFIEKRTPGDKLNIVRRQVRAEDTHEFARQYQAFKAGQAEVVTGTPLKEWPAITRSQAESLAYHGIRTVEELANLSDGNAQTVGPGMQALKQKAKDFIEKAKGNAPAEKLRAELSLKDSRIEALERQMKDMAEKYEQQAKAKR